MVNLTPELGNAKVITPVYPEDDPKARQDAPHEILPRYHSQPHKLRIACVGAGASGLCLSYKMQKLLDAGTWELTLFEKNKQFGGTWFENTYPGVACDVPSHLYTYTFHPNTEWNNYYAFGDEIQRYFEGFAKQFDLQQYIKLNTKVVEARWSNDKAIWEITLEDQVSKEKWEDWAHVLINGTGTFAMPRKSEDK
jgi:cation diffusion facilitator CzcD-associated flavoprotein CzcO